MESEFQRLVRNINCNWIFYVPFYIFFLEMTAWFPKIQNIICLCWLVTAAVYVSLMFRKIIIPIVLSVSYQKSPYNLPTNLKEQKIQENSDLHADISWTKAEGSLLRNPTKESHFSMVSLVESELQSHQFLFKVCIHPDNVYFGEVACFSPWLSHCAKVDTAKQRHSLYVLQVSWDVLTSFKPLAAVITTD